MQIELFPDGIEVVGDQTDLCRSLLRTERDRLLVESDWTQLTDVPIDHTAWATYRQTLRELPDTIPNPSRVVDFPDPPA